MNRFILTIFIAIITTSIFAQTTWYEIDVPTENNLNDIDFPTDMVGYIAADSGILLKSIDGGENWDEVIHSGIDPTNSFNFVDIDFVDADNGFAVTGPTMPTVFKTVDGGTTWEDISAPFTSVCYKNSLFAIDANNTFLGGAGCFQSGQIERFNNGVWSVMGVNYESFDTYETVLSIDFYNNNYGLAAMRGQFMLRTIDGGTTWDTIPTGISATGHLTSVDIVNDTLAYAGYDENGGGFGILRTVDGGLTWEQDMESATFFYPAFLSVAHSSIGDIYSGALSSNSPGGLIFERTTGNTWWDYQQVDQAIYSMDGYGDDVMFGVGDSGYVVVNTPFNQLSTTNNYDLIELTVFPNPANDRINVKQEGGFMNIQILSIQGQVVHQSELTKSLETIDISNLESGTYLLYCDLRSDPVKFIKQ
jgi:photosystem II stability/assembly factor-like uncharacterized protein